MNRKRITQVVLALLIAAAAFLAVGFWRSRPPKPDMVRDLFGNARILSTFETAQTVTAHRLHNRLNGDGNTYNLENYQQDAAVAVAPDLARRLQQVLLQENSYGWRYAKMCAPEYGVLFTFRSERGTARVALCFDCNIFGVYEGTDNAAKAVNREDDFDPMRHSLLPMIKSIFPQDPIIQALKVQPK